MRVIGLTGGIGCGKSTVARMLQERDVPVVDADAIAREIVAPREPALAEIARAFGPGVIREDGSLDRKALAGHVFSDERALARLNAITHPRIGALAAERFEELRALGHELAFLEAALLFEAGWCSVTVASVVVTTRPDVQLERLLARGDLTPDDARARIAAQMPLSEKEARADHLIRNDGDLDALAAQVDRLLETLRETEGSPT